MIEFERYTLPNGLRVIHNYDPSTVMVAVNVLYNTGARDERRSLTGIAHLFEHLMFGGSANVPEFDKVLENAGGESNAWTSNDFTNFYDVLPAQNAETAFYLESDRMLALAFSSESLEIQRSVVIEEFKQQCLNRPYGDMMHGLRRTLYSEAHPYSWPVIGLVPEHIERVQLDDIKDWFYSHYAPNNAVLAISGNLSYAEGRRLAEKWFGEIPARNIPLRQLAAPGYPEQNRELTMHGNVPHPNVLIAIPMSGYGTAEYRVADCITDILSAGKSSRIYRNLVANGDGSIIEADASISGAEEPGFLMLSARTSGTDEASLKAAAIALLAQLEALAQPGNVSEHELERTLNRFESTYALSNFDAQSKAQNLAMAEMHGEDINDIVAKQRSITTEQIADTSASLMARPRVTVYYLPN